MKMRRMTALLLCFALLLSLSGCKKEAPVTQTPATVPAAPAVTQPPERSAEELYSEAATAVENAADLSVRASVETVTAAGALTYVENSQQVIRYLGRGTDGVKVLLSEIVTYGEDYYTSTFQDVYADGMAYSLVNGEYRLASEVDAASYQKSMIPAVLLDLSLYASVEKQKDSGYTTITFAHPAAAESWAMPEGAQLVEASGTAVLSPDDSLYKTTYTITYTYGAASVTRTYSVLPTLGAGEILLPQDAEQYVVMENALAARLTERAIGNAMQTPYMSATATKTMVSLAAGLTRTETKKAMMYLQDDFAAEVDTDVTVVNATTEETETSSLEEWFWGQYEARKDGGEWEADSSVDIETMYNYTAEALLGGMVAMDYWKDATIKDLGSLYMIEFVYSDQMAKDLRSDACQTLLGDPRGLDEYSTESAIVGVGGYFAVDKFTGVPTAAAYSYVGTDVIEEQSYAISVSNVQSFVAPDDSVYYTLTGETIEPEEPEEKATPLMYHVTGADGQELYLMGTIHVGDARAAYLPEEVYAALEASDALAVEFDLIDFEEKMLENAELQAAIAASTCYLDGTTVVDHADAQLMTEAETYMKATGNYNTGLVVLKPGMWAQTLENFYLRQSYSLSTQMGVDRQLILWAYDNNRMVVDIESGEEQMEMLGGFSDELQELLLEQALSYEPGEYGTEIRELYELWCGGNENELRQLLNDTSDQADMSAEEKALYEEYQNAMIHERNEDMLEEAISYLESDHTIFFAVGLAHLLQDNGLVDALENVGYTVKQVGYLP